MSVETRNPVFRIGGWRFVPNEGANPFFIMTHAKLLAGTDACDLRRNTQAASKVWAPIRFGHLTSRLQWTARTLGKSCRFYYWAGGPRPLLLPYAPPSLHDLTCRRRSKRPLVSRSCSPLADRDQDRRLLQDASRRGRYESLIALSGCTDTLGCRPAIRC